MMVYNILTVICLLFLLCIAFVTVYLFAKKSRKDRIEFIKKFKKGNCAIVYLAAIPLYTMGYSYTGEAFLYSLFSSISKSVNLVVLKYELSCVLALMEASILFKITLYFCFVLVAINAFLFTISLFQQRLWLFFKGVGWRFKKKEKLFLFGNNSENIMIYESEKNCNKIILGMIEKSEREKLYIKKIYFGKEDKGLKKIEKFFNIKSKQKIYIIVNYKNDLENIKICSRFIDLIQSLVKQLEKNKDSILELLRRIHIYVFGSQLHKSVYDEIVKEAYGCIRLVDKYKLIAMDFIDKHPFTQYLTQEHLDYSTCLLKENVDINVLFVGFGKTNRQIFFTSVANNQFLSGDVDNFVLHPVHYHIFDKEKSASKNLNHDYYRYRNEFYEKDTLNEKVDVEDYLPLPPFPAREDYYQMDINEKAFYETVLQITKEKKNVNYIIIAFGTDLENIDLGHKLSDKKREWGLNNLNIFVKIRKKENFKNILKKKDFILIADEKEVVYNINRIISNDFIDAAIERNRLYKLEYEYKNIISEGKTPSFSTEEIHFIENEADYHWFITMSQIERDSNIFACLSLRFKLQLLGFDYAPKNTKNKLNEVDFLKQYALNDEIIYYNSIIENDYEKKIVFYDTNFKKSLRYTMAILEHYRWNAYMLSKGVVPAKRQEILGEKTNGKNYSLRRHGNLTTMDGLVEFRKMIANRDGKSELETDVIKYDYQIMDDVIWLLTIMNQDLIRKS